MAGCPAAVGTGLAALLTVAGVVVTKRSTGRLRVMAGPVARRRYSLIVGVEFGPLGQVALDQELIVING